MATENPILNSPAHVSLEKRLQADGDAQHVESSLTRGRSTMQLRNKKVITGFTPKPRVRSQTITKHVGKPAPSAASEKQETISKLQKPRQRVSMSQTTVAKKLPAPSKKIPVIGLGCRSPVMSSPQIHEDPPAKKETEKVSKLPGFKLNILSDTSTRVFRDSKQFSPVQSPQHTPNRLSRLHMTLDKENTPPTNSSMNLTTAKPATPVNSPQDQRLRRRYKSQLPRRSATKKKAKPPKKETSSTVSSSSALSSEGEPAMSTCSDDVNLSRNDVTEPSLNNTFTIEKSTSILRDILTQQPSSRNIFQEPESPKPMSAEKPVKPAVKSIRAIPKLVASTGEVKSKLTWDSPVGLKERTSTYKVASSVPSKCLSTLAPTKQTTVAVRERRDEVDSCVVRETEERHEIEKDCEHTLPTMVKNQLMVVSDETVMNRPQPIPQSKSLVLPVPSSQAHIAIVSSSVQSRVSLHPTFSIPRNVHQPVGGGHMGEVQSNFAMCGLYQGVGRAQGVCAHPAPLCAVPGGGYHNPHMVHTDPRPPGLLPHTHPSMMPAPRQEPPSHHCTCAVSGGQTSVPSMTSRFKPPVSDYRTTLLRNIVTAAASAQKLLDPEHVLESAADREVEKLMQETKSMVFPACRSVNPIASTLEGDLRKYAFRPIHVPTRTVMPKQGSAFQKILIC